jgi:ornithine cyclodeaminase/alanine dehydrogenase-like protein (mu-crystallin family)
MALVLSRADVERCLSMSEAIEAMRVAFTALSEGEAHLWLRSHADLPAQGQVLLMPALLTAGEQPAFALKVLTALPTNPTRGLPRNQAIILLLEGTTGRTLAIMEGGWLTTMRTAAASGLATALLARADAEILALFGAGAQAPMQVLAMHSVRPLREVRVVNRNREHYEQLVIRLQRLLPDRCPPVRHCASAAEALADALLVVCATASTVPLFQYSQLAAGVHINAIGAFTPAMCEVDAETLAHARIVVDQREAALAEAGDLLQALAAEVIPGSQEWTELGAIVTGRSPGRCSADEITVFKSVGLAVQDLSVALHVYQRARASGLGSEIEI